MSELQGRPFIPSDPAVRDRMWQEDVNNRLETLETAQGLRSASVKGGAITVWSRQNNQVTRMGLGGYILPSGESREAIALAASTDDGRFHLLIDHEQGWAVPNIPYGFVQDTYVAVTSGSYVGTWKTGVVLTGHVVVCEFVVTCDSGTTGDVRLFLGERASNPISIAASQQKTCRFSWDVSEFYELGSRLKLSVQARRLTGTNNVNVYAPDFAFVAIQVARDDATTEGPASE